MSEARLIEILSASPRLMSVLRTARDLDLNDWMIFSGAVYQTAWNALTGRDPDYGIKDYDLGYFDPDTSWDAEDAVIDKARRAYAPPLDGLVEVRNQSRVHLWFEQRFGEPYAPLIRTADALTRFVSPTFAVGARLEANDRLAIQAPFGLDDLFALTIRPNPLRPVSLGFAKASASAKARWPEITLIDPA